MYCPLGKPDAEGRHITCELTDLLLELGVLWDEYGIVRDIVINNFPFYAFVFLSSG